MSSAKTMIEKTVNTPPPRKGSTAPRASASSPKTSARSARESAAPATTKTISTATSARSAVIATWKAFCSRTPSSASGSAAAPKSATQQR